MVTADLKQLQRRQAQQDREASLLHRHLDAVRRRQKSMPSSTGQKYVIRKADGSPADPEARYLVLRLDTDPLARQAAETYADAVAATDPRLAEAVRSACAPKLKADWKLPRRPRCKCGAVCRPVAMQEIDRWILEWECDDCCDPVDGPHIPWPFVQHNVQGEDFERLGIDWDIA